MKVVKLVRRSLWPFQNTFQLKAEEDIMVIKPHDWGESFDAHYKLAKGSVITVKLPRHWNCQPGDTVSGPHVFELHRDRFTRITRKK